MGLEVCGVSIIWNGAHNDKLNNQLPILKAVPFV